MTYKKKSERLLESAELRWRLVTKQRPDLGPAVALQRKLVGRSLELGEAIDRSLPVRVSLEPTQVAERLARSVPFLIGEPIELEAVALERHVLGFCDDLSTGEALAQAQRLRAKLDDGALDIGSLLTASIGRQQEAIRIKANHLGVAPDLLWLVAELASGPIVHRLYDAFRATLSPEQIVTRALAEWDQGFCPVCGSWPAFGERHDHTGDMRSLRCSFCGTAWRPMVTRCIYCETSGPSFMRAAVDPDSDVPANGLELCRQCGGYLKSLAVSGPTPVELIPVEDLCTNELDVGAARKRYARPPMRVFGPPDGAPCPPTPA